MRGTVARVSMMMGIIWYVQKLSERTKKNTSFNRIDLWPSYSYVLETLQPTLYNDRRSIMHAMWQVERTSEQWLQITCASNRD